MSENHSTTPVDLEAERKAKKLETTRQWRARNKEKVAAYNKEWNAANKKDWYQANKEKWVAREKAQRDADPEKFRADVAARMRAWRRRHPDKAKAAWKRHGDTYRKKYAGKIRVKKQAYYKQNASRISDRQKCIKYGLTLDQLAEMRQACKGRCPHCKAPFSRMFKSGRECIDHCHATGVIRGLICGQCNLLLGLSGDDPKLLRKLARYLDTFQEKASEATSRSTA